ncbi:YybH family protein [Undibacterium sp. Ji50W]|uniref:YybH family protein n=1 Tax=Undibacterium sp. Ji50W TaxID=3413041 RepID=UPI003BF09C5F
MLTAATDQAIAAIQDCMQQWQAATAAGDVDKLLDLMDEEVVFLVAGNTPMKGRQQFAQNLQAVLQTHSIASRSDLQEIVVQADLAYSWAYLQVSISPRLGGQPILRSGNVLSIWRLQANGKWRICRDANLLTLEPPATPGA